MSLPNCKGCGCTIPEQVAVCPCCGTAPTGAHDASAFPAPDAAERWVTPVAKAVVKAENTADKVGDVANKVRDIAGDVADKVRDVAGGVADQAEGVADRAADATGWVSRLIKRIVFVALLPLWLVLMLFGCGPLS